MRPSHHLRPTPPCRHPPDWPSPHCSTTTCSSSCRPPTHAADIDLGQLATEPWIISERCRHQTLHACTLAGFTPTIALATDDYQHAVPRLVAAGLGVSLTTACISRGTDHPDVTLVPVAGIAPRRIIAAALPASPRPTHAVQELLNALHRAAHQRPEPKHLQAERVDNDP